MFLCSSVVIPVTTYVVLQRVDARAARKDIDEQKAQIIAVALTAKSDTESLRVEFREDRTALTETLTRMNRVLGDVEGQLKRIK